MHGIDFIPSGAFHAKDDVGKKKIISIDKRPEWIVVNEVGKGFINHSRRITFYSVLKKEVEPNLPGFLGYADGEHLIISEEVPKEYRRPQLIHEIECARRKGQKGRCVEALKRELENVPFGIRPEYIKYRTNFFANLVAFYQDSEDEDFKAEIQASYEFLQGIS